jgi:hypothetical protein
MRSEFNSTEASGQFAELAFGIGRKLRGYCGLKSPKLAAYPGAGSVVMD